MYAHLYVYNLEKWTFKKIPIQKAINLNLRRDQVGQADFTIFKGFLFSEKI